MSQGLIIAKPADGTPISDSEYNSAIALLKESCPAFQRYQREHQQFIIDRLSAANMLIEASQRDIVSVRKTMKYLHSMLEINRSVIDMVRRGEL